MSRATIPGTPQVTSPPPTSTTSPPQDSYFAPITRSRTNRTTNNADPTAEETESPSSESPSSDSSFEKRARSRSRSPKTFARQQKKATRTTAPPNPSLPSKSTTPAATNGANGHLSPSSAAAGAGDSYWRSFSRSPSPLGLIPIHRHWRSFVHRHEIPRKALHMSIGFVTLTFYARGVGTEAIHPWLLGALVPIASMDYLRHTFPGLNRWYIRCVGALMRETEVEGWNGVIWYLLGAWTVLRFMPKDVAVMGVLLLSWCDTAASTVGRLYGRYTPRIRRGKSLAGSAAAAVVGVLTAGLFWGWAVPRYGMREGFLFQGQLRLPDAVRGGLLGWKDDEGVVGGWVALGIVSMWSGVVASASEVVDVFGWDDNLTIPVLSGLGLWGFFKVFC